MKRIDRIYEYIKRQSSGYAPDDLRGRVGVDAAAIASALGILRNNVSMELNALHRQDKIIKLTGRPVLYFDKRTLESLCETTLGEGPLRISAIEECVCAAGAEAKGPFARLIGAEGSLKKQVEQAKAAILYPPDGLHTLIVGQTGVGKTLFARMMYEYGKAVRKLEPSAPFITFNCADYYNNAQLLISHIFGHVKGAFTGADAAKAGLVEEADTGILFLDEIHRLPPEGQEMIFYFIDTGTYNRLGETTRARKAKVLIIGATTEDPSSALTKTFVRRIPNIITIRPLLERSLQEKIEIIRLLLTDEVQRIQKPVKISVESIKALIGSIGAGNVGQLKSNIKLLCAKAFLNGIDNPSYIEIDFKLLPTKIKTGLLTLSANRKELAELSRSIGGPLFITPRGQAPPREKAVDKEPFNLYQVVENKVELLKGEGIRDDLIKQIVAADVNAYIKSFYSKQDVHMSARARLLKIVDKDLVDFTEEINLLVEKRLGCSYKERFLYAFSLHLSAFLKRIRSKQDLPYREIEGAMEKGSPEFQAALEIKGKIEARFCVEVPKAEIEYFALLLKSLAEEEKDDKIVIVVATHGKSTATSMAEVARQLCSSSEMNLIAVDMPLEENPEEILEKMIERIEEVSYRRGVLLLADMGSLLNFGAMIMERLKVQVKTIDMVSTPLVLEAMRKADIAGMELSHICESLRNFKGYEVAALESGARTDDSQVIVTICASGEGAAVKLKELVEETLRGMIDRRIEVIPVGVKNLESALTKIAADRKIIAAVGMTRPKFDVPFIPLEKLIHGEGEIILQRLLGGDADAAARENNGVVRNLCEESLQRFLTYLNPAKVMSVLLEFDSVLEKELQRKLSNPVRIRLIVHLGCALERMVTRSGLAYGGDRSALDARKVESVKKSASVFESSLRITLTDDEIFYICEMI